MQAPHEVVDAPPGGPLSDDLARGGIDVEMGAIVHHHLPRRDRPAEVDRRLVGIGSADRAKVRRAGIAGHHLLGRIRCRQRRKQGAGVGAGEARGAIGQRNDPARARGALLEVQGLKWHPREGGRDEHAGHSHRLGLGHQMAAAHLLDRLPHHDQAADGPHQQRKADDPAEPDVPTAKTRTNSPHGAPKRGSACRSPPSRLP